MSERAAAVKAAYEAGLADFEMHAGILHPAIEFQTNWPGLAPAVHGVEGVRRWSEAFREPWEWVRFEVREIVDVDEETAFVWNHVCARGKGSGVELEMDVFDVLTFRGGQIVLRRTWTDRASALAAARLADQTSAQR
jgi:ketosteroid isomerase-like protein